MQYRKKQALNSINCAVLQSIIIVTFSVSTELTHQRTRSTNTLNERSQQFCLIVVIPVTISPNILSLLSLTVLNSQLEVK